MVNKNDNRERILLDILALLLTVCFLLLGFRIFIVLHLHFKNTKNSGDEVYHSVSGARPEYLVDGQWYVQKKTVETFLLIGVDKYDSAMQKDGGYRNSEQSDVLFLLAVDRNNQTYFLLHINRDTMANIRMLDVNGNPYSSSVGQLALSHTYGSGREDSCENTVWSVSDYLYGLQIDHYVAFSMDSVAILNDQIGGVTVTVLDDMTMIDAALVQGATVTLRGEQALSYVRARLSLADSTNLERMKRQRQYVTAFLDRAHIALSEDSLLASETFLAISDYLVSDMTVQEMLSLVDVLQNDTFEGILTIEGEAITGEKFMEFYADESLLKKLVLDNFYEEK